MALDTILAGIGAIVTAAGGVILVVREFRRRDRQASIAEIEQLNDEVHALRADFLSYRHWAYDLAVSLTNAGINFPPAPPPVHVPKEERRAAESVRGGGAEASGQGVGAESSGSGSNGSAGSGGSGRSARPERRHWYGWFRRRARPPGVDGSTGTEG